MARESYAWRVSGIEPPDDAFRAAGEAVRRQFWRSIASEGVAVFRARCGAGLDRRGEPLAPIAGSTRRKGRWRSHTGHGGADNPPLVPALGESRTEDLLRGRGHDDHAEFHWVTDPVTGLHWGRVMGYHRAGKGRYGPIPVRDVIGFSPADVAELRRRGQLWWYHFREGHRLKQAVERLGLPAPKTGAVPPPPPVPAGEWYEGGRTDLEHMTAGPGTDLERTRRAIAEGYHTGFRKLRPGAPTATRRPEPPSPPPPAQPPAAGATHAGIERRLGVKFGPAPLDAGDANATVIVDVKRLDRPLSMMSGHGSSNPTPRGYQEVRAFIAEAREKGTTVHQPRLTIDSRGNPVIEDGRHRFAVLRDQGAEFLPVSVPRRQAEEFRRRFGPGPAPAPAARSRDEWPGPRDPKRRRRVRKAINRARRIAAEKGVKSFPIEGSAEALAAVVDDPLQRLRTIAVFDDVERRIVFNPDHGHWLDPAAHVAAINRGPGGPFYSTGHRDHVTRHEVGHELHDRAVGRGQVRDWKERGFTPAERSVARRVSGYAAEDPVEFVSEVYAARWDGVEFDADVMALYARYRGPV